MALEVAGSNPVAHPARLFDEGLSKIVSQQVLTARNEDASLYVLAAIRGF